MPAKGKVPIILYFKLYPLSTIEIAGFLTALTGVYLTIRQNRFCWPVNMMSAAIYAFFFMEIRLYADAVLQLFFIVMGVFGWISWSRKTEETPLAVSRIRMRESVLLLLVAISVMLLLGHLLQKHTDASIPYLDSFCFALSIIATWLAARKILESWTLWIITDAIYTGMYLYKASYLTALLYLIFIVLAVSGYREWKRTISQVSSK
jgi:nicotinamide mononucleotide transporter